jgi:hypothetical protein
MTDSFENELRRALRPLDAPEGFAERLMRKLPERKAPVVVTALPVTRRAPAYRRFWAPAALAASIVVSVLLGQHVAAERAEREQRAGLAASRELMQALHVTSQKLDLAYQAVNSPPPAGEEENRS